MSWLSDADRDHLVELLEGCTQLADVTVRAELKARLRPEIRRNVADTGRLRLWLAGLVRLCDEHDGGLLDLIQAVQWFEGESDGMREVKRFLGERGFEVDKGDDKEPMTSHGQEKRSKPAATSATQGTAATPATVNVGTSVMTGGTVVHGDQVQGDKHEQHFHGVFGTPGRRWRMVAGLVALGMVLALAAWVLGSEPGQRALCRLPGIHGLCAAFELGGVAGEAEQSAWCAALARLPSPDGLQEYLREYRDGVFAREAESRLAHNCPEAVSVEWRPTTKEYPLVVRRGTHGFATKEEALRDAKKRGQQEARDTLCQMLTQEGFRLLGVSVDVRDAWTCRERSGWTCGFDGKAVCSVEESHSSTSVECSAAPIPEECRRDRSGDERRGC